MGSNRRKLVVDKVNQQYSKQSHQYALLGGSSPRNAQLNLSSVFTQQHQQQLFAPQSFYVEQKQPDNMNFNSGTTYRSTNNNL
jgi:hypothetical protein